MWKINDVLQFQFEQSRNDFIMKKSGTYLASYYPQLGESIFTILSASENATIACGNDSANLHVNELHVLSGKQLAYNYYILMLQLNHLLNT